MKEAADVYADSEVDRLLPYWREKPDSVVMRVWPDVVRGWIVVAYYQGAIDTLKAERVKMESREQRIERGNRELGDAA